MRLLLQPTLSYNEHYVCPKKGCNHVFQMKAPLPQTEELLTRLVKDYELSILKHNAKHLFYNGSDHGF